MAEQSFHSVIQPHLRTIPADHTRVTGVSPAVEVLGKSGLGFNRRGEWRIVNAVGGTPALGSTIDFQLQDKGLRISDAYLEYELSEISSATANRVNQVSTIDSAAVVALPLTGLHQFVYGTLAGGDRSATFNITGQTDASIAAIIHGMLSMKNIDGKIGAIHHAIVTVSGTAAFIAGGALLLSFGGALAGRQVVGFNLIQVSTQAPEPLLTNVISTPSADLLSAPSSFPEVLRWCSGDRLCRQWDVWGENGAALLSQVLSEEQDIAPDLETTHTDYRAREMQARPGSGNRVQTVRVPIPGLFNRKGIELYALNDYIRIRLHFKTAAEVLQTNFTTGDFAGITLAIRSVVMRVRFEPPTEQMGRLLQSPVVWATLLGHRIRLNLQAGQTSHRVQLNGMTGTMAAIQFYIVKSSAIRAADTEKFEEITQFEIRTQSGESMVGQQIIGADYLQNHLMQDWFARDSVQVRTHAELMDGTGLPIEARDKVRANVYGYAHTHDFRGDYLFGTDNGNYQYTGNEVLSFDLAVAPTEALQLFVVGYVRNWYRHAGGFIRNSKG